MAVTLCPLASGSSGNCSYIATEQTHLLIDAGLSGKKIESALTQINVSPSCLDAIFITHEHNDHIIGAGVLSRRYDLPLFATEKTWAKLENLNLIGQIAAHNKRIIYNEESAVINDIKVCPYPIPHDAAEPVGFTVTAQNRKIAFATDFGHITDTIREYITDSDALVIESNHDMDMLMHGPYPYRLKKRISSDSGHLSNETTGTLITQIFTSKLKHIYLAHLSEENNTPSLAHSTVLNILTKAKLKIGVDLMLHLAQRSAVSSKLCLK